MQAIRLKTMTYKGLVLRVAYTGVPYMIIYLHALQYHPFNEVVSFHCFSFKSFAMCRTSDDRKASLIGVHD